MEFLIELLIDLIIEGSIEISSNKKMNKWVRYSLIILIVLFFTVIIMGLFIIGILLIKKNILASLFII